MLRATRGRKHGHARIWKAAQPSARLIRLEYHVGAAMQDDKFRALPGRKDCDNSASAGMIPSFSQGDGGERKSEHEHQRSAAGRAAADLTGG